MFISLISLKLLVIRIKKKNGKSGAIRRRSSWAQLVTITHFQTIKHEERGRQNCANYVHIFNV